MGQAGHKQKNSSLYGKYSKDKKARDSCKSTSATNSPNNSSVPSFSMKSSEKACNLLFQELEMMDKGNKSHEQNPTQNSCEMNRTENEGVQVVYPEVPGENYSYGATVEHDIWYTHVDFNPNYAHRTGYENQSFGMESEETLNTSNNARVQIKDVEDQTHQNHSASTSDVHYSNKGAEGEIAEDCNRTVLPCNTLYSKAEIHPNPDTMTEQCYYQCVDMEDETPLDGKKYADSCVVVASTKTVKTTEPLLEIQRNLMQSVVGNAADISAIDVIETRLSPSSSYNGDEQSIEEIDTNVDIKDNTGGSSTRNSVVRRMVSRTVKKISLLSNLIRHWKFSVKEKDCLDELQRIKKKLFINPKEVLGTTPPTGLALSMTNLVSKVLTEASSVEKDIHPYGRGNMYTNAFAGKKSLVKLDPGKLMFWGIVICMVTGAAFGVIILSEIHRGSLKRLLKRYNGSFPDWY